MKKSNFFKFAAATLCAAFALTATSCSDDDDNKSTGLKCNPSKVEVVVGGTSDVKIAGGTEAYTVKSTDEKIATVKVNKSTFTVTGVAEGKATVTVTDAKKLTTSVPVTVTKKTK